MRDAAVTAPRMTNSTGAIARRRRRAYQIARMSSNGQTR
jgi:hypothetical protein